MSATAEHTEPRRAPRARTAQSVNPHAMTEDEAAAFLRVSRRTLQRHRKAKQGPAYSTVGRAGTKPRVTYTRKSLVAWLCKRRIEG